MGWFGNDSFDVGFDAVDLDLPVTVAEGDDIAVTGALATEGGSDDYGIEEIQLYLDGDDGRRLLAREEYDQFYIGGSIDRQIPFTVDVDASAIGQQLDDDRIEKETRYELQAYVITREAFTGQDRIEDYWSDRQAYIEVV